jgi:hypothetical protein
MKRVKSFVFILLALITVMSSSACYWQKSVSPSEVGLQLNDGISISSVVGAGRYDGGGWYSSLWVVDIAALNVDWEDPDLVTLDKQPIGLKLAITYQRSSQTDKIKHAFSVYRREIFDNAALASLVASRVPEVAKDTTSRYTLDQMLGIAGTVDGKLVQSDSGRLKVGKDIFDGLQKKLDEIDVVLLNVQVANIAPDAAYMQKLKDKAAAIINREIAKEQTTTLAETLKQAKAQTDVDLEVARRQNLVNEEIAKVYTGNPQFFQLKMMEAAKGVFGDKDKIVFVPAGSPLSFVDLGNYSSTAPVVVPQPVAPAPQPTTAP